MDFTIPSQIEIFNKEEKVMPRRPKYKISKENNTYAPLRFTAKRQKKGVLKGPFVLSKTGKIMDLFSGRSVPFGKLIRGKK